MRSNEEYAKLIIDDVEKQLTPYPWEDEDGNRYGIKDQHFVYLSQPELQIGQYQLTVDDNGMQIQVNINFEQGSQEDEMVKQIMARVAEQAQLFFYWHQTIDNNPTDFGKELEELLKLYQAKDYIKYRQRLAGDLVAIRENENLKQNKDAFLQAFDPFTSLTGNIVDTFTQYEQWGMQMAEQMAMYHKKYGESLTINSLCSEAGVSKDVLNAILVGNWAFKEDYQKVSDTLKLLLDEKED